VQRLTVAPARIFGLSVGTLKRGAPADIAVLDLDAEHRVDAARLHSKSRNTPFAGWQLRGRVAMTLVAGQVVHEATHG
jgi:dihydroorotase